MIELQINGICQDVPDATLTLQDLITHLKLNPNGLIIEHNECLYKEDQFSKIHIIEGDNIDIIYFMGGG